MGLVVLVSTNLLLAAPKGRKVKHSQEKKGFVAVSIGGSIPISNYAATDSTRGSGSGYAKTGVNLNLTAGYKFLPFMGAMIKVDASANKFDIETFAQQVSSPTVQTTATASPYSMGSVFLGPFFSFSTEHVDFDLHTLVGASSMSFPKIGVTQSIPGYPISIKSTFEIPASATFAYNVGAGLKIKFGGPVSLLLNADYFGAEYHYTNLKTTRESAVLGSSSTSSVIDKRSYKQKVDLVNLTVGVAFNF